MKGKKPLNQIIRDLADNPRKRTVILKFGGSTTGASDVSSRLAGARKLIESKLADGYRVVPVFSALRRTDVGITNLLLNFREIIGEGVSSARGSTPLKQGVEDFRRLLLKPHLELAMELDLISGSEVRQILDKRLHRAEAEMSQRAQALIEHLMAEIRRLVNHALVLYQIPPEKGAIDHLISGGERLIVPIIAEYLNTHWSSGYFLKNWGRKESYRAEGATAQDFGILTDDHYGDANIDYECLRWVHSTVRKKYFKRNLVPVLTGFDGIYKDPQTNRRYVTTLGRSGSDYTATFLGFALRAEATYLLKDTPGVLSANPKLIAGARPIPYLSYQLAVAAGNIQDKAIGPARDGNVPVIITEVDGSSDGTKIGPPIGEADGPVLILDPVPVRYLVVDKRMEPLRVAQVLKSMDEHGVEVSEFSRTDQGLLLVWKGSTYDSKFETYLTGNLNSAPSKPGHHIQIVGCLSRADYTRFVEFMIKYEAISTGICDEASTILTTTIPQTSKAGMASLMSDLHETFIVTTPTNQ